VATSGQSAEIACPAGETTTATGSTSCVAVTYLLTTMANPTAGGTVTPPTGNQTALSTVNLTATPTPGYVFSGWTGSTVANAASASTTIKMSGPESVTANFTPVPIASISPTSGISFGTLYLGSIVTQTVTITNTGKAAMTISDPLIAIVKGGNSNEFVTVNLCPKSLAAGNSCTMTVTFVAGPDYTPQTADLMIYDNAAGSPQAVPLTATVIDPVPGFNPTSLNFGTEKTLSATKPNTITITSVGGTELSISKVSVTGTNKGDFSESDNCAGNSFNPTTACTVSITFTPAAKGLRTATLVVTDNALVSTQSIPLSGTGD